MIIAFLPCRAGSQRVPHKNTRPFGGELHGLLGIKLRQLLASQAINRVVVSTNDPEVIAIAEKFRAEHQDRLTIDVRPDHLCSSSTPTDAVITYVPTIVERGTILWTHVTSPFFDDYDEIVRAYRKGLADGTHDSLMAVNRFQSFLWNEEGPVNYDRSQEKWPRTQTLSPLYEVNSAAFIIDVALMRELDDRVGRRPVLFVLEKDQAMDVDWEDDFKVASDLFSARSRRDHS